MLCSLNCDRAGRRPVSSKKLAAMPLPKENMSTVRPSSRSRWLSTSDARPAHSDAV